MSARNYYVRSTNAEELKSLEDDYKAMGRDTMIKDGVLTVFAKKRIPAKVKAPARGRGPKPPVDKMKMEPSPERPRIDSRNR